MPFKELETTLTFFEFKCKTSIMRLKNKRVLVTGGAGFIGSHLAERLLKEGASVVVLDDLSEGKWENLPSHPKLRKVKGSILGNVSRYVRGQDFIFHLAALPRLKRSLDDPWQTHRVNVDGTLNLLMEAKKYKVKRFVFASSSSVYGNKNKTPFSENMIPDPLVPYSLQKVMGESYCEMFHKLWGLETVSLRYFNIYGPRMNPDSPYANLIPKFIKLFSQNKTPTVNGSGRQTRDFTYIDDAVEATLSAARSKVSGEIFNIGFGKRTSVNKVVRTLNKLLGKNIKPKRGPAVIEPRATLASTTKAGKILGWKPKVSLEEGLKILCSQL